MLCQKCKKNNATTYYKEVINGKTTEYTLCDDCRHELEKSGEIKKMSFAGFEDRFDSLFGRSFFDDSFFGHSLLEDPIFSDIFEMPMVGASRRSLASEFFPTRHEVRRSSETIPEDKPSDNPKQSEFARRRQRFMELNSLKSELKKAVKAEEFEKAAELRDRIKAMENEDNKAV